MSQGSVAQSGGPASLRPALKRSTQPPFSPHWVARVSEGKSRLVIDIGNGRYCIVTTSMKVVSAATLAQMGLTPPAPASESETPDLPWSVETTRPVPSEERAAALHHWADRLGGYDRRLTSNVVIFLRELGLEGVKQAIDQVAAANPKGGVNGKYELFIRVIRQMRERRGQQGGEP